MGTSYRCPLVCSNCYLCPPTILSPMCPDRTWLPSNHRFVTDAFPRGTTGTLGGTVRKSLRLGILLTIGAALLLASAILVWFFSFYDSAERANRGAIRSLVD